MALIDPEICIAGREITEPTLSPDGNLIACVVAEAGVTGIRVLPIDGGPERLVSAVPQPVAGRGLGGGCLAWVDAGRSLVYVGRDGAMWTAPVAPGGMRRCVMASGQGFAAPAATAAGDFVVLSRDDAEIWLVWLHDQQPPMRLDLGEDDFVCDPQITAIDHGDGRVSLEAIWQAWSVPDMAWDHSVARRVCLEFDTQIWRVRERSVIRGIGAILQPRLTADGRVSAIRDDHGWLNLWCDEQPLIEEAYEHGGPTWGPGLRSYAWSPDATAVAFTRNEAGFGRLCVLRVATGEITEIARGVHGHLDWRGEHLVAIRTGAKTPTQIVSYRLGHMADHLGSASTSRLIHLIGPVLAWDAIDLTEPELITVPAATSTGDDTEMLHARVYRAASESRRDAAVVWVHGGPTDQWQVTFMPRVAWLCSLGLDVVVVDPRGSTGHGRQYQQALCGGWGDLDASDTAALISHYHAATGTRPECTVIAGSSSGGLTVLSVLRHHSALVAGGIAISPVSDLLDLSARSHRYEAHYAHSLVGDPDDAAVKDRYRYLSPVNHAAEIHGPLVIIHGEEDPVVPADHSRVLAEQITAAGGQVDLHLFPGEGHGFRQIPHRVAEYRLIEEFINRILATNG
jgi:dipeptidyl aminopeptidase/acylaminoacyl peptidase